MNKSNEKKKINVVDVVIILLVLALLGTIGYRIYSGLSNKNASSDGKYVITFKCVNEEYDSILNYLSGGKEVYLSNSGVLLGTMYDGNKNDNIGAAYQISLDGTAIINEEQSDAAANADKKYELILFKGTIKLSGEAVKVKGSDYYAVEGTNITVGGTLDVYTDEASFTIRVESVDPIK